MPIIRNKDNEPYDTQTGFVYNEDGSMKRTGLPGAKAASAAEVKKSLKGGDE